MTKNTMKRALFLLALGGATFHMQFSGFPMPQGVPACVTNGDAVGFYQTVGEEAVTAFEDATATALFGQESDFDNMVIEPVAALWRGMWDNKVAQAFPLDIGVSGNWLQ